MRAEAAAAAAAAVVAVAAAVAKLRALSLGRRLHHRRSDGEVGRREEFRQTSLADVGQPGVAHGARGDQGLDGPPLLPKLLRRVAKLVLQWKRPRAWPAGLWAPHAKGPVDEVQVDVPCPQVVERLPQGPLRSVSTAGISRRHLGCDEELRASHDALGYQSGQGLSHLPLVLVDGCAVKAAIAGGNGGTDCRRDLLRLQTPRAKPNLRHLVGAWTQREGRHGRRRPGQCTLHRRWSTTRISEVCPTRSWPTLGKEEKPRAKHFKPHAETRRAPRPSSPRGP